MDIVTRTPAECALDHQDHSAKRRQLLCQSPQPLFRVSQMMQNAAAIDVVIGTGTELADRLDLSGHEPILVSPRAAARSSAIVRDAIDMSR